MAHRICVICGASFDAPPSNNRSTCSPECSRSWRSRRHKGVSNTWSEAAKDRLRAKPTPAQLSLGKDVAMALPGSQRGEQHRESMVWELISPSGQHIVVIGLEDWARRNAYLFGESEDTAYRISSGFRQIAQYMRGKTKRTVSRYKGWSLACLPSPKST